MYLRYNKDNREFASEQRRNMTQAEQVVRENILRKDQTGCRFLRQKLISGFVADFYCAKLLLVIEID